VRLRFSQVKKVGEFVSNRLRKTFGKHFVDSLETKIAIEKWLKENNFKSIRFSSFSKNGTLILLVEDLRESKRINNLKDLLKKSLFDKSNILTKRVILKFL